MPMTMEGSILTENNTKLKIKKKEKIEGDKNQMYAKASTFKIQNSWTVYNEPSDNYNLPSHILLIFKYYIYISREKRALNIDILIANSVKVKKR